ncbi:MAG: MDR family MFS transporter [Candidatus Dormibacteria bacterium]|jgi:EmrB/QacA subfamily drug resistance transporter
MSAGISALKVQQRSPAERRRLMVVFGALMLAMLIAALDQTIVSTALPTIVGDLGGLTQLSWVVTAYILTSTISTPLYGKIGDLYGRKRIFQGAIVIFLVGSMLCGLSQNMAELIGFRALQGIGAGGLFVGSQAIIGDIVSPRERGRYMGYFGAVFGLATVAGPLLGGFLVDHATWRWVFYINVPIGIAALIATGLVLHLPRQRREHRIDYLGASLLGAGVTCIVLLTTWGGNEYPWASAQTLGLALAALVLLGAFLQVERRAVEPILPLKLFRNSVFAITNAAGFIIGLALFGSIVFLPQYLQIVKGEGATNSGLLLVPMMVGLLITSIVSGQLISRTGRYKVWPILGTGVTVIGLLLLSTMTAATPQVVTAAYMVVLGLGLGGVMQVLVVVVQNSVTQKDIGVATSTATFFRSMGGSIGVPIFGAIFSNVLIAKLVTDLPKGFHLGGLSGGIGNASPQVLDKLPPLIHSGVVHAFSQSLGSVFLAGVPFAVIALVLVCLIKEVPLRTRIAPMTEGVDESFGVSEGVAEAATGTEGAALSLAPREARAVRSGTNP